MVTELNTVDQPVRQCPEVKLALVSMRTNFHEDSTGPAIGGDERLLNTTATSPGTMCPLWKQRQRLERGSWLAMTILLALT